MFSSNASQVSSDAVFIEDVMSTFLYTGNGATQTITNGIDLAGKGGMVWIKGRNIATNNLLFDTNRGVNNYLVSDTTGAQANPGNTLSAFNANGFTVEDLSNFINETGFNYASWTFRKQPKFFDVVTYTGNGSDPRNIAHNLGSVPGSMIIKCTSTGATDWYVYHRSLGNSQSLNLNQTGAAETGTAIWGTTTPTSTVFTVGNINANTNGRTYVAYLFAHDAGGFGLSGEDNVVTCGSFTTSGSGAATVTLGYEPQWVLFKVTGGADNWIILDNMRGWSNNGATGSAAYLYPNDAGAEGTAAFGFPTATGFQVSNQANSVGYIYVAIRRGPMKVPTDGTKVFAPVLYSGNNGSQSITAGFPVDMEMVGIRNGGGNAWEQGVGDRLRGNGRILGTAFTSAENNWSADIPTEFQSNTGTNRTSVYMNFGGLNFVDWMFRRAPGFFDVVCYTGTGSNLTLTHNLTVPPELVIIKARDKVENWVGWSKYGPASGSDFLSGNVNDTASFIYTRVIGTPTATQLTVSSNGETSGSGFNYVAYLFATCAGVSKVGSYTGTGTTQAINCGFTTGARFIMIKRTDSTGDWYVWDSARGIVANSDPYLLLNSTAAEVTGTDYIDPSSAGFEISSTAPAAINASGGSFIFLAVA